MTVDLQTGIHLALIRQDRHLSAHLVRQAAQERHDGAALALVAHGLADEEAVLLRKHVGTGEDQLGLEAHDGDGVAARVGIVGPDNDAAALDAVLEKIQGVLGFGLGLFVARLAVDVRAGPGVADVGAHFLEEVLACVAAFFADAAW